MLKNKLFKILLAVFLLCPLSIYAYSNKVVLGGENVGIKVNSKGILVVGFYNIGNKSPGKDAGLMLGDIIIKVDDTVISKITDLSDYSSDKESLNITYKRFNKVYTTILKPKLDNGVYKTGLYVKNNIIGIGTLTFIDPATNRYGALGHEIVDASTGSKFEIDSGKIFNTTVTDISKSEKNSVGEKNATYDENITYGTIDKNEKTGIYGDYTSNYDKNDLTDVSSSVVEGPASIVTVIDGDEKLEFSINILSIDLNHETKNILFEVTDERLLQKSNGIVQGMSGSPIKQNGKLVGAVTHVMVDDPHKGYGILVTNMLKESTED